MKKLSIVLLLCVFTIPANAGFKGKVGSSEFCSSTKRYADSTLQVYQMNLKLMSDSFDKGMKDRELKYLKAAKNDFKDLHMVSNIYSAWCK